MKYEFPTIGQAKKIDLPEDKKLGFGKIMAPWIGTKVRAGMTLP